MASVNSISSAVGSKLITNLARFSGAKSIDQFGNVKFSSADEVSATLNAGGRAFAKAFQNVNNAGSFLNLSIATLEQLDKIVSRVITLAERGAQNGIGAVERRNISAEYRRLGTQFAKVLDEAQAGDLSVLSREDIATVLMNVGLDKDRASDLASFFSDFVLPTKTSALADDRVRDPKAVRVGEDSPAGNILERVSVKGSGVEGNATSGNLHTFSSDGRLVVFASTASNLVNGDTNGFRDIFVRDIDSEATRLVSVSSEGVQGNGNSTTPHLSANGRYAMFTSSASNMVSGDTNGVADIFLRDLYLNTTERISVDSSGAEANGASGNSFISADGRYVVFQSDATNLVAGDTNGVTDIFLRDRQLGTTTRVSLRDDDSESTTGYSADPSISADGRYVVFTSSANDIIVGDANGVPDIFVRDTVLNTTTRVSISSAGAEANSNSARAFMTPDGRYITFESTATNLVAGDTNLSTDIFLRDTVAGTTVRANVAADGTQANFTSVVGSTSSDGRYILFLSQATNLVSGSDSESPLTTDVFLKDLQEGTVTRVSLANSGDQPNNETIVAPSMTPDASRISFATQASNLVDGDTNSVQDVFIYRERPFSAAENPRRFARVFDSARSVSSRGDAVALLVDAKALRRNIRANIEALESVRESLGANMGLLRATALGMLDAAKDSSVLSVRDAQGVADRVRSLVVAQADPAALRQSRNLDTLLAVALTSDDEASS